MARTIVGEAFIQILPTDGGVTPGVQKIIDNLPKSVNVPVTADTAQATKNVDALAAQITGQVGGAWEQAAIQAATFTAAILGVRAAVEGTVNKLAGLFDQLAQAQAGFTAILGSQSAGQQLLDDIREFARVSPFVTQELVNYSQQLLGVGQSAESIVPLLKSTGDLIASVGGDTQNISRVLFTLTQIRSIGRLVGQDAIQLQSALVPITKLLADFLGKTTAEVKKLQEQGAISADTVFAAITNAGSKVEGAMATATRNIGGARSVLSDTIQIMLQDSVALNAVFDDVVQGIIRFSDAIGSNVKLQQDIASIDASLASLYENLQPLLEGLADASTSLALSSLDVLASGLQILASALDAIPEGALRLLGQGLAIIAAIRAPLFLIQYVRSIGELGKVLQPANVSRLANTALGIKATGDASQAAAPQVDRLTAAMNKHVTTMSAMITGAGLLVTALGQENDAMQTIGATLTGAGIGAQLGSAFGPAGTLVGLAAGAGIGFVTSFVTNAREEAARQAQEIQDIGAKSAKSFLDGFAVRFPEFDSANAFETFFADTQGLRDQVDAYDQLIERQEEVHDQLGRLASGPRAATEAALAQETGAIKMLQDEYLNLGDEIDNMSRGAKEAQAQLDSLASEGAFAEAAGDLASKLSAVKKESEEYVKIVTDFANAQFPNQPGLFSADFSDELARTEAITVLLGDSIVNSAADLETFRKLSEQTGLTLDQYLELPLETLVQILEDKIPNAVSKSRIEIAALRTTLDEAKKATEEFYKPFVDQINSAQAALQASESLTKSFNTFVQERTDASALALGESYLKVVQNITTANEAAFKGSGTEAGISFLVAQLDSLKEQLDLTEPAFRALLQSMGLLGLYNTGIDPGFTGSLEELAEQLGVSEQALTRIIPSLNDLKDGQEITINTNILEKIEELRTLTNGFTDFATVGPEAAAALQAAFLNIDLLGGIAPQLNEIETRLNRVREGMDIETRRALNPSLPAQLQEQQAEAAVDRLNRQRFAEEQARIAAEEAERIRLEQERLAEAARREAERIAREQEAAAKEAQRLIEEQLREQERLRQALKDAGETIESAMQQAAEEINNAARAMTANLRERVQDDEAVSVTRLIRNAQDQANRVQELGTGIETLRGRGLSNSTIEALGIDNVADIRQLRRLLGASSTDLQQLNSLVGLRDSNAEAIARRERQQETQATIVAAIIQAAQVLGYEISPERAAALALQVNITGDPASAILPTGIIEQIQNAGVLLRT
jgi:tape measure domain-containing protein